LKAILYQILYRPLFNILILIYSLIPDMGVSIIILTIIIRLILYPSQGKALKSQKRLRELQPELDKVQNKYKNNKQKQSKAVMEFYQKNKVSPFASCLPTLIQFPIIIAMYQVFRTGLDTSKLTELYHFIHGPAAINPMFLGYFDLTKPDRFILPIIAGVAQFIQIKMMMPKIPESKKGIGVQQMISRQMIYLMPLMIVFFAASLPSALPLYWIITSLFGIFQQYVINKGGLIKKRISVRVRNK